MINVAVAEKLSALRTEKYFAERAGRASVPKALDILKRPDIKDAWEKQGATPLVMTQTEFAAFMDAEIAKWAKVIEANHIALIN